MPASQVDWTLPVAILAVGLVVGVLFVWLSAGRKAAAGVPVAVPAGVPLELRDLEGRRDVLFAQLRELEDTAAKRSSAQHARERYALELDAARVLRALERHPAARAAARAAATAAPAAPAPPAPRRPSAAGGFLWGVGSAALVGALLFYVSRSATTRTEGGAVTGDVPGAGQPATGASAAPLAAEEQSLRAVLQRNPDDLDARLALAQIYLGRHDMMGVWNETQYVLQRKPGEPHALAYQSLVRVAMGQPDLAVEMLQQALKAEPNLIEGYVHLALAYRRLGRDKDAETAMADALSRFPEQRDTLSAVFDEMRRSVTAQETPPDAGANPHAGFGAGTPAAESTAGGAAAAPSDPGRTVAGVVELDPALAGQVPAGATLFIVVREARLARGAPTAVKRLDASSFPLRFELGDGDSMAGEPLPDPLRIEARLDGDGNAATREPGEPVAVEDGVRRGARGVRLVLRRP